MERDEKYREFYLKVQDDVKAAGLIKDNLMEVCSVELDRNGNEKQVNLAIVKSPDLPTIRAVKRSFDHHAKEYDFTMNYTNISGDIFDRH